MRSAEKIEKPVQMSVRIVLVANLAREESVRLAKNEFRFPHREAIVAGEYEMER